MFANGSRLAAGEGQHKTAVEFAEIAMGEKIHADIYIFDKMSSKRHHFIYNALGLVSPERSETSFCICRKVRQGI